MFDYDKLVKKLGKFDELSKKKQGKVLEQIFCSPEFRDWFYGVGENANSQPMTKPMINKIFSSLTTPAVIKRTIKFIKSKTSEDFDQSACTIAFLMVEQAIEASNNANREIAEGYKNGEISSKEAKNYKEKSEQYGEYISAIMEELKEKARGSVKEICKKSNLPKEMVYSTYFMIPDRKYIPKYKIGMYANQLLQEIYKWTGNSGIEDVSSIKWGPYFGSFFGSEMTSSVAISILLEGVRRIDAYRDAEYFDNVREIWDSLTNFAMNELDRAPENIRRQMLELYIKRIDRIFRNGNGPRLRVDILNIPANFQNLADTISRYTDKISKITKSNARQVESFQEKYVKPEPPAIKLDESSSKDDEDDELPSFDFETSDSDDEDDE